MTVVQEPNPPITEDELGELLSKVSSVPQPFIDFLRKTNGGYSPDAIVDIRHVRTSILLFLGVGIPRDHFNILDCTVGPELLPTISDGAGNLFCLSLRTGDFGTVWFWDHDTREAEKCADSWDEFLSQIRIED